MTEIQREMVMEHTIRDYERLRFIDEKIKRAMKWGMRPAYPMTAIESSGPMNYDKWMEEYGNEQS